MGGNIGRNMVEAIGNSKHDSHKCVEWVLPFFSLPPSLSLPFSFFLDILSPNSFLLCPLNLVSLVSAFVVSLFFFLFCPWLPFSPLFPFHVHPLVFPSLLFLPNLCITYNFFPILFSLPLNQVSQFLASALLPSPRFLSIFHLNFPHSFIMSLQLPHRLYSLPSSCLQTSSPMNYFRPFSIFCSINTCF